MVDAFLSAMEKADGNEVGVVVMETGWPSLGNQNLTSSKIVGIYNRNLLDRIKANGTPKRPTATIDGYFFSLFYENQKPSLFIEQIGDCFILCLEPVGLFRHLV